MKPITPRTLDWIAEAPVQVSASRRIHAPVDRVWARVADHATWPAWWDSLKSVEPGTPPSGVGGHRRVSLGAIQFEEEFLAWEDGARFAFCVTHMTRRMVRSLVEDVVLEPVSDDVTAITYTQAWDPIGGRPVQAILRRAMPKQIDRALAKLAELLDG